MSVGTTAAASAAAAAAQAIKASGAIVQMDPKDFQSILSRSDAPLVVYAQGGLFKSNHQYLTSYKGLFFFTKSSRQLNLPGKAEVVAAKRIWIP